MRDIHRGVVAWASEGRHRYACKWLAASYAFVLAGTAGDDVRAALHFGLRLAGIAMPNPASIALHESIGFAPLGIYREVGFKFDRWHDVGWWQRPLR